MKLIFAGTPDFAAAALQALLDAGHDIALVLTQPDRPAGRGKKLRASPVKVLAQQAGIAVSQPERLRDNRPALEQIQQVGANAMVVAAYGLILPLAVLQVPRLGCLNIHASLLPRWRGAAPIQRAIEAGDTQTGITIMQMDEGLDTGDMLLVRPLAIEPADTGASLHDRLARLGASSIVEALAQLQAGTLKPVPQPGDGVTYAHRLGRDDSRLDWRLADYALVNRIRAFDPVPGNVATLGDGSDTRIKIWRAAVADGAPENGAPGEILCSTAKLLRVACGSGAVDILELQRPGGRRLPVAEFQPAVTMSAGMQFALPPVDPAPGGVD